MRRSKRFFDLFFTIPGLVILIPVFAVAGLLIKLYDGGPVFFRQERVGLRGRRFRIWKFRTMVVNAERLGTQLTVGKDPRITPVGNWLRKTKLDELPQLLNVLTGEMSLVGPRPEVPRYVSLYTPKQREVLNLPPGITDLASIKFVDESAILAQAIDPERAYRETIMPEKVRINLEYAAEASVLTDVQVVLLTFSRLLGWVPGRKDSSAAWASTERLEDRRSS